MNAREKQKLETKRKILDSAAALFRRHGVAATGIDAIMSGAGLTAGGFYAHFDSKERLLAECLREAFEESWRNLTGGLKGRPSGEKRARMLKRYLSSKHRDLAARGCPLVGIGAELARHGARPIRETAEYLERFARELGGDRSRALGDLSRAVGALLLARLTEGQAISDELLEAARPRASENSPGKRA